MKKIVFLVVVTLGMAGTGIAQSEAVSGPTILPISEGFEVFPHPFVLEFVRYELKAGKFPKLIVRFKIDPNMQTISPLPCMEWAGVLKKSTRELAYEVYFAHCVDSGVVEKGKSEEESAFSGKIVIKGLMPGQGFEINGRYFWLQPCRSPQIYCLQEMVYERPPVSPVPMESELPF